MPKTADLISPEAFKDPAGMKIFHLMLEVARYELRFRWTDNEKMGTLYATPPFALSPIEKALDALET